MSTARVALECVLLAVVLYVSCFVAGWWLWKLAAARLRSISVWSGAPIAGLTLVMTVGYYWVGHAGIDDLAPWLLGAALLLDAGVLYRTRGAGRVELRALRSLAWPAAVAGATAVVFSWHHIEVFRLGRLSSGSLFLADVPNFALIGDHLARNGLRGLGSIVGYDVSALAAQVPGTSVFISLASAWTGRAEFEVTLPAALFCVVLVAFTARDLARLMLPWSEALPAVLAVMAAGVSIFVYSAAHYPLSQLLAAPAAIGFLAVTADAALRSHRPFEARRLACAAVCLAPIVLCYPHMALLAPPLLVGIALVAGVGRDWMRRCLSVITTSLGAVAVVVVVLPGPVVDSFTRLRNVEEVQGAGFALTLLTPVDLLGFRSGYLAYSTAPNAVALFALEAAVIAIAVVLALRWTRGRLRSRAALAGGASLGTLLSYGAVFVVRGASYEQWKWAAFVVPIFVVGTGSIAVWACVAGTRRSVPRVRRLVPRFALGALLVAVFGGAVLAHDATRGFVADSNGHTLHREWDLVGPDLTAIGSGPAFDDVRSVNVELGSTWDSSWAAYFLAPRTTFLAGASGLASVAPRAPWTLERSDKPFLHPPASDVRVLNDRFRLVRERPDQVAPGTSWVVGECDGVYRFDGRRWQGIERTPETGGFEISWRPGSRPPRTRVPLLVRAGSRAVDALLLEYLPRGRARIVAQHVGAGTAAPDRRLGPQPRAFTSGPPFDLVPGSALELSVVFDPITGEQRVASGDAVLFDSRTTFLVRPSIGETDVGKNTGLLAAADGRVNGTLSVAPRATPVCDSLQGP